MFLEAYQLLKKIALQAKLPVACHMNECCSLSDIYCNHKTANVHVPTQAGGSELSSRMALGRNVGPQSKFKLRPHLLHWWTGAAQAMRPLNPKP